MPYDGRIFIADSSAWARTEHPAIQRDWEGALGGRQIATCPPVVVEMLYSARIGEEFDRRDADLAALRDIAITRSVTNAARQAYRELAQVAPGHHRSVRATDLLIAACAQDAGIGVLHYDADFDRLAEFMTFESRWIAPRSSLT
jgi:predicted nucleic acid-binding protein